MQSQRITDVKVLKVDGPDSILVKLPLGTEEEKTGVAHTEVDFMSRLNEYMNAQALWKSAVSNPIEGKAYVVKDTTTQLWERAVVKDTSGILLRCLLIDRGDIVSVQANQLLIMPTQFENIPPLCRRCKLHGIAPRGLQADINGDEYVTTYRPKANWDAGTASWLRRQIQGLLVTIEIIAELGDTLSVTLIVASGDQRRCINEEMVKLGYAYDSSHVEHKPAVQSAPTGVERLFAAASSQEHSHSQSSPSLRVDRLQVSPTWRAQGRGMAAIAAQTVASAPGSPRGRGLGKLAWSVSADHPVNGTDNKCVPPLLLDGRERAALRGSSPAASAAAATNLSTSNVTNDDNLTTRALNSPSMPSPCLLTGHSATLPRVPVSSSLQPAYADIAMLNKAGNRALSRLSAKEILASKVVVNGDLLLPPVLDIQEMSFPECVSKFWNKWGCTTLHPVQSFVWPIAMRNMNIMAISPLLIAENELVSHEILTYLLPIAAMMVDPSAYKRLPIGNGPIAIILASSWKKTFRVHNHIRLVFEDWSALSQLQKHGTIRCRLLCGDKDDEETHSVPLLNGCEILCATPHSLLRMLNRGFTNFFRLCHFILHDADVLIHDFHPQLSAIMEIYSSARNGRGASSTTVTPCQWLLFGQRYSHALHSFVHKHVSSPTAIITSKFEASIYGRVKQVVCASNSRQQQTQYILDIFDLCNVSSLRTLVFTSSIEDARFVYKTLTSASYYVMLATEDMPSDELDRLLYEWHMPHVRNSQPLLVLTDSVHGYIDQCKPIRDARLVVHFGFPARRQLFGERLHCMSSNYCRSLSDLEICASHVVLTSADAAHSPHLVKLLERLDEVVPDSLKLMADNFLRVTETIKMKELCTHMKAFGDCRSKARCSERHIVSAKLDSPRTGLPTSGLLKVKVLYVKDAATYYGRLLVHRENNVLRTIPSKKFDLDFDMQQYYAKVENKIHCHFESIKPDELYAYEALDGVYLRAMVTRVESEASGIASRIWIMRIDEGSTECVVPMKLFMLPDHFSLSFIPPQVVEIRLCRVMPLDQDLDFSPKSSMFVDKLMKGKTVEGNVVLCLRNTIWLDPVVHRELLSSYRLWVTNWNIRTELLDKGLVARNDDHIVKLRAACRGKVELPAVDYVMSAVSDMPPSPVKTGDTMQTPADSIVHWEDLHSDEEYVAVFVPYIMSPDTFFANRVENYEKLSELELRITMHVEKSRKVLLEIPVGCFCIARFIDKENYARAQVLSKHGENVAVIFVDHGDTAFIRMQDLFELPDEFLQLPLQAIECSLAHVIPIDGSWSDNATDVFLDFTQKDGINKFLFAKIAQRSAIATYVGARKYAIELIDTSGAADVSVSELLVQHRLAIKRCIPIEECIAGLNQSGKCYEYEFQKIPDMYSLYLKLSEASKKSSVVERICQIVLEYSSYKDKIRECGALAALCQLVKDCSETLSPWLASVIHCLAVLSTGHMVNCEEICLWEKLLSNIFILLKRPDATDGLHEACTEALSCFMSNESVQHVMMADGIIEYLWKFLTSTLNSQVQQNIIAALTTFIDKNNKNCVFLSNLDVESGLSTLLQRLSYADGVLVRLLNLLRKLLSVSRFHALFCKSGAIKVMCNHLFKSLNEAVFTEYVKTLTVLASTTEGQKAILAHEDIESKFRHLMQSLPQALRIKCSTLLQSLSLSVRESGDAPVSPPRTVLPACKELLLQPIPKDLPPLESLVVLHPPVVWRQSKRYIGLAVKQPGVSEPSCHYGTRSFEFRAHVDGTTYHFLLSPLYGEISSEKCYSSVRKSEVLVYLRKAVASTWPQLLQRGHKPHVAVKPDFEAIDDESDDSAEEEDEDNGPAPFTYRKRMSSLGKGVSNDNPPLERSTNCGPAELCNSSSDDEEDSDVEDFFDQFDI